MIANVRSEAVSSTKLANGCGKTKSSLLAIFDRKRREPLIWFGIAVAAWVWAVLDRHSLVEQLTRRREVVVIDSQGTYYVTPDVDTQHAKELHAWQTKLACKALFERNPDGLDNPELFKQLFLKDAAKTAQVVIDKTEPEFQAKVAPPNGRD